MRVQRTRLLRLSIRLRSFISIMMVLFVRCFSLRLIKILLRKFRFSISLMCMGIVSSRSTKSPYSLCSSTKQHWHPHFGTFLDINRLMSTISSICWPTSRIRWATNSSKVAHWSNLYTNSITRAISGLQSSSRPISRCKFDSSRQAFGLLLLI